MARMRSPNYPCIGLDTAIKLLQQIWNKEERKFVAHDALAKAMGYNGATGAAKVKISALRRYGLLDCYDKTYQISPLGIDILHGQPDTRAEALRSAALRPTLFRELFDTHRKRSNAALHSHLTMTKRFSDRGAYQFIKAFRATMAFAKLQGLAYSLREGEHNGEASSPTTPPHTWTWTLSVLRNVRADLRITGEVTKADIARLKKQIEFLDESFEQGQRKRSDRPRRESVLSHKSNPSTS
jgi:hypothetical protein